MKHLVLTMQWLKVGHHTAPCPTLDNVGRWLRRSSLLDAAAKMKSVGQGLCGNRRLGSQSF